MSGQTIELCVTGVTRRAVIYRLLLPISRTCSASLNFTKLIIEEPVAAEEAVSSLGELRHKADDGPERGAAQAANLDLNGVEVHWPALAGDDTAHVVDGFCRSEFNAQDLCKFGWEDVAI